jgi:hypothetical protein
MSDFVYNEMTAAAWLWGEQELRTYPCKSEFPSQQRVQVCIGAQFHYVRPVTTPVRLNEYAAEKRLFVVTLPQYFRNRVKICCL